jgi:hypothetical protein
MTQTTIGWCIYRNEKKGTYSVTRLVSDTQNKYSGIGKAVPQHTYRGAGGSGCIAPSHLRPRH